MQLPYNNIFQFYEGTDEQQFSDFNGVNLNNAPNQLLANDVALAQALSDYETTGAPDSQKLAGVHASQYVRTDLGASLSGAYVFNGTNTSGVHTSGPIQLREVGLVNSSQTSRGYAPALTLNWGGLQNTQLALESDGVLRVRNGSTHATQNPLSASVLFENNVSLSSKYLGLTAKAADSDLLDGLNSSDFLRTNARAADSDKLGGIASNLYLRSGDSATNSSALGNKPLVTTAKQTDSVPWINSSGSMDIGKTLDLHFSDSTDDFDWRLTLEGSNTNSNLVMFNDSGVERFRFEDNGRLRVDHDVVAYYSDERLKTILSSPVDCLDAIMSFDVIQYVPNQLAEELSNGSYKVGDSPEIGLKAKQVENYYPELVTLAPFDTGEDGKSKSGEDYKTVKYDRLVSVLVGALQEQQEHIEALEERLDAGGL